MSARIVSKLFALILALSACCAFAQTKINLGTQAVGGSSLGTAAIISNGTSPLTGYAGGACTNQFVRSLSVVLAPTCATVGIADQGLSGTAGRVLYEAAGPVLADSANLTFDGTTLGANALTVGTGTFTINTATTTFAANNTATRAIGAAPAGVQSILVTAVTYSGDAGGTTNLRSNTETLASSGSNPITLGLAKLITNTHGGSATMTAMQAANIESIVSSTGNVTNINNIVSLMKWTSSGSTSGTGINFIAQTPTLSSSGTAASVVGFQSQNMGTANVTNAVAFQAQDQTAATTLLVGYDSQVSAGTGKWNVYSEGTANNGFAGGLVDLGYSFQTPSTGFSITLGNNTQNTILDPAGALLTGTITLPAAPVDGQIVRFASSFAITTLTVSPNSGQSVKDAITTLAAGGAAAYLYRGANTTWYRVQ